MISTDLKQQQLETVSRSEAACDRARTYAAGLASHLARLADEGNSAAARRAGDGSPGGAEVAALRSEASVVEKQLRAANAAVADLEVEHVRHAADLAALYGSTENASGRLAEAHVAHRVATGVMAAAAVVLGRAQSHLGAAENRLAAERDVEREHERATTGRLQAALRSGADVSWTEAAAPRASLGLSDDVDTARALVARLSCEHGAEVEKVAKAAAAVDAALDGVLAAEAEAMATEVEAIRQRSLHLRSKLQAFATRPPCQRLSPPKLQLQPGRIDGGPTSHVLHHPTDAQMRALTSPHRRPQSAALAQALLPDTAFAHGAPHDSESYWRGRESELSEAALPQATCAPHAHVADIEAEKVAA